MRCLLFSAAVIVGVVGAGLVPATATPLAMSGFNGLNVEAAPVEEVGYWRRQYRRYGYPVPYAYYPPAYGYYAPPPAYGYYAPPPASTYYPPAYGYYPSPAANGEDPSAEGDYGDHPPEDGDYPSAGGDYSDYPPGNGS
jgi:hypothetical protein